MAATPVQSVLALNSSLNQASYTGGTTITPTGGIIVAIIHGTTEAAADAISISSITLDGVAMAVQGAIAKRNRVWSAIAILANANQVASAVAITLGGLQRSCSIRLVEVTGHDTSGPVVQDAGANGTNGASGSVTVTTTNADALILGGIAVQGGTANTTIAPSNGETLIGGTSGRTGSTTLNDHSWAESYQSHATTGAKPFGYGWTGADDWALKAIEVKSAPPGVSGGASGTLDLTGSATGTVLVSGTAAGTLDLTGQAAGTVRVAGQAAGTLPLSGAAAGQVRVQGQASGVLPIGGAADGQIVIRGQAAGVLDLTGAAAGTAGQAALIRGAFPGSIRGGRPIQSPRGGRLMQSPRGGRLIGGST